MNDGGGGGDCFRSNFRAITRLKTLATQAMAAPDLQIRVGGGGGGGSSTPCDKGDPISKKKIFFRPFGPQFGLEIRTLAHPLDPPMQLNDRLT